MSEDKKEYDVFKGLINGNQMNTLNSKVLLNTIRAQAVAELEGSHSPKYRYVLHDGSDIRKPDSWKMESIGKVMSLEKEVINGYKTMNSVLVEPHESRVTLLEHRTYSTGEPDFVTQGLIARQKQLLEELKATPTVERSPNEDPVATTGDPLQSVQAWVDNIESGTYINNTKAYLEGVQKAHDTLRRADPSAKIVHIQDREMDSDAHFEAIETLGDEFITRMQLSRLSNETVPTYTKTGKISKRIKYKKLIDKDFEKKSTFLIPKLTLKGKTSFQVTCQLEWEKIKIQEHTYSVVRITLMDSRGIPLFQHPMILITNRALQTGLDAQAIYHAYLLRFKIEIVFRFLKQNLGWETFQIRDFESIKNLIAFAFFLAGYFKELSDDIQKHEMFETLARLGGGKGIVSVTFLLRGIEKLVHFQQVQQLIQQGLITQQDIENALQNFTLPS
jgi:Transposase DDE domain